MKKVILKVCIEKKQKQWVEKEAKKFECSEAHVIRSLIRNRIEYSENKHK